MMRGTRYSLPLLFAASIAVLAQSGHTYKPPSGYVPDEATAIKIAVAVWEPIYGAAQIAGEKPYQATLHKGIWTVLGSLPPDPNVNGGVAVAEISKEDGRIIRLSHGK